MTTLGHNGGPPLDRDTSYPDRDGFITVGRSIRNHPIVGFGVKGPYVPAEAWLDLIMECKYREGRVNNGGHLMTIRPGQMVGAVSWLAQRWSWTPKQVRHFLDRLEEDGMITRGFGEPQNSDSGATAENHGNQNGNQSDKHRGKQAHFLTICNYAIYQFVSEKMGQTNGQMEGQSQGTTKGNLGANKGQQYIEEQRNTGTKEQEEKTPLPPEGGSREERAAINRKAAKAAFSEWQAFARRIDLSVPRDSTFEVFGKKLATRLFEHAESPKGFDQMMAVFDLALANVEKSKWLRGMTTNFRADLKFLCQRESFAKLINGDYGNGAHAEPKESKLAFRARVLGGAERTPEADVLELEAVRKQ